MDQLARAIVIAAIIVSGAVLVRYVYPQERFEMVATANGAFRIDKINGVILFCDSAICRTLPLAALVPAKPPEKAPGTGT